MLGCAEEGAGGSLQKLENNTDPGESDGIDKSVTRLGKTNREA
jgi:hypothetical protein